jgi:hypothetical protein
MRQSLIYSRAATNTVLSAEAIMQRAPAVFAEDKAARLTNRYHSLKTSDLLPVLADYGYLPVQAAQKRARKPEHTAHLLAFARAADVNTTGDVRSELLVYNSHDGTSGVKLMAGAYRFVCSNGIVNGNGNTVSVRHTHKAMEDFETMLRSIIEGVPDMMNTIESMRQRRVDEEQARKFAKRAVMLRWDYLNGAYVPEETPTGSYADSTTVTQALTAQRSSDTLTDAWTVFNRVQENVLRGNVFIKSITDKNGLRERKARPIASISEHVAVNQAIFDLAGVL